MAVFQYNTTVWDISAPFEYWYPKKENIINSKKTKTKKTNNIHKRQAVVVASYF